MSTLGKLTTKLITQNWHPGQAALAGTLATAAYSIAIEGDKFLIGNFQRRSLYSRILEGEKRTKPASYRRGQFICSMVSC